MLHFLASNAGSIVVYLVRQKKRGQPTCGGGCAGCSGACHSKL